MRFRVPLILILLVPATLLGATLSVPDDYPTIGSAITAAAAGDEILIAPGTYDEHDLAVTCALEIRSAVMSAPVTIDACGLGTVMRIEQGDFDVSVTGIRFTGGVSIHATGTSLFDGCTFENCSAPIGAQAYLHDMDGYEIAARFNCCAIDTDQFAGPVWDAGLVEITHDGCAVPSRRRSWSEVKDVFE